MTRASFGAFASLTSFLMATTALAQTAPEAGALDLGTLVLSADNRLETPVDEATRSVTVIPREDIERQGGVTQTVADVLANATPGFSQSTEALTDFGQTLRGRTFLVLIDGVPQSTPLRDGRRPLKSIDPASVERIEIVRGGNATFGLGASGGTVNIVTKHPEEGDARSIISAGIKFSTTEHGDSFQYDTRIGTTGRTGNLDNDRQRLELTTLKHRFEQHREFGGLSFDGEPANDIRTPAVTLTLQSGKFDIDDDGGFDEDLPNARISPKKLTAYVEFEPTDWWTTRVQAGYSGTLNVGIGNVFNSDYTPVINQAYNSSFAYTRAPGRTISASYKLEF